MQEVWKDISGYEGVYQVSNLGRVKSMRKWSSVQGRYCQREKILKQYQSKTGYLQINLKSEGTRKLGLIHRLVAQAFIPNPDNKREVNHINGNKTDNRVENLEWCTSQYNTVHAYKTGLETHPTRKISQYDLRGDLIKEWDSIREAGNTLGIQEANIGACCRGIRKTAGGYAWEYKEGA